MVRLFRASVSFAAVLCGYLAYSVLAVPLIEPAAEKREPSAASGDEAGQILREPDRWRRALAELLPGSNWPVEKAKILASSQLQLVFWEYANLGGGRVQIRPCVIIYTPEGHPGAQEVPLRQAVVLEAPDGAMLEFDEPLSLTRMKIGRLKSGKLSGRITIRSQGKRPGPEDDLMVTTKDVELTESRVWTTHPVTFRFGASHGRGHQMLVKLVGSDEPEAAPKHGPDIVGIESFEVRRLEQLHLEFGDQAGPAASPLSAPIAADLPIEVSCHGPFRFEPQRQQITFEDRVNLLQIHPEGPSDQICCDLLTIYLARPRTAAEPPPPGAKIDPTPRRKTVWDLEPRRIEARGQPVLVSAKSEGVEVRGQRLDYDFQSGRIVLDGSEPVFLKQDNNEILARDLQYEPGDHGALGQVVAGGPGRLVGQMDAAEAGQFTATWGKQLQIRPVAGQQVISLTGGAEADYGGLGGLAAAEIHCYLTELPPVEENGRKQIRPDSMLARGNVALRSPQLSGQVEQVEVWFEEGGDLSPEDPAAVAPAFGEHPSAAHGAAVRRTAHAASLEPIRRPAAANPPPEPTTAVPGARFEISGGLLRARMIIRQRQSELTELLIEGDVRLSETYTSTPGEMPLVVTGNRIHMVDVSRPHAAVTITGAPAHFEGRGLGLSGANISLNRGTNRLWIDGPGHMDLPMPQGFQGQSLPLAGTLAVDWQEKMSFDGRTAVFEGTVVATAPHQTVQTEILEVSLKTPIRFDKPPQDGPQPEPQRVRCRGGVLLESESLEDGNRTSLEKMRLGDLDLDLLSGQASAGGPGWMTTVRRGSGGLLPGAARPVSLLPSKNTGADDPNQLTYLSVRFRGSISGNLHQRELTFSDQVRTVYGPVDSWDATFDSEDLDSLGPRGVILSCERLKVSQMPQPHPAQGEDRTRAPIELEATRSVMVEGQTFTARAARMTYTEAKDLLLLEGDGRNDAHLYYQQFIGAPYGQTSAQQIWYWPSIPKVQFQGAKSFEWSQLPGGTPGKGK